ncbi:MAG: type VI secretion system tip protein VgrG [Flavobacteriia bacterium]|nr:type VI secretion system tip protein VgrG [Flavobacteriia bacterium]
MGNNTGVIQTSKSADLITYKILIEGEQLPGIYGVMSIVVSKEVNRIPMAQIVLVDGDASQNDFPLSNEDLLIPGKKIEIQAGYHSDDETIFKGMIVKHSIKVRSGASNLIIECKDEAVKMTIGRKSKYFYDSKDSDVFEEIIGTYSLDVDVEATSYSHKELVQYNASDWDFIVSRAQANGKLCFVNDGKVTIKKPDFSQTELETVAYGMSMLDFDSEIDARNQLKKATSFTWNPADQELVETEGADPGVSLNGNLSSADLADVVGLENLELRHGGRVNDTLMQGWADATLLFQQLSKVRGRVKFQGIPAVLPNTTIKLEGVGDRFNGKVYVTGVFHNISKGNWTVDVQFGLNPEWFSETYEINPPAASGLLPAIKGLHVGVVTQLQEDPDGEDRILVKIPIINSEEQGIWCRVSTLDAGDSRGSFFRPEIEDEVIVGFINEDPNQGIVLGMMNSSAKPAPIVASDDNHEKGFVTRSEMKFMFNDDKKSVTIETPGGKKFTMDEDKGVITLEDEHKNIITMDDKGIKIESAGEIGIKATKDLKLEGMNINIKASAQLKAEGSAGAELSTGAIAVVKGSLVQIN